MFASLTTGVKLAIAGVLLAFIAILVGINYYEVKKNSKLQVGVEVQKGVIKNLDETVALQKETAKINQAVNVAVAKAVKKVESDTQSRGSALEKKVAAIEHQYATQPKTPEVSQQKTAEISRVRASAVWDEWCAHTSQKTNPMCQPSMGSPAVVSK